MARGFIALVLVLSAAAAEAQGVLRRLELLRGQRQTDPRACNLPELPNQIVARWIPDAEFDRIAFCMDEAPAVAQAKQYQLHIANASLETGTGTAFDLAPVCGFQMTLAGAFDNARSFCTAFMPSTVEAKLRNPGGAKRIAVSSKAGSAAAVFSQPALYDVPRCQRVVMDGNWPTLDTSSSGLVDIGTVLSRRQTWNLAAQAEAIGMLRRLGWRVEWSREQFALPSSPTSGDGGFYYTFAQCVGYSTM